RAQMLLDAVELISRQIFPVRQRLDAFVSPAHSDELLDMAVPGSDVVVADWPGDSIAITLWCGEIGAAPACTGPPPDQRLSTNLITPYPVEGLLLDVGMISILHEEMCSRGVVTGSARDEWILLSPLPAAVAAQRKIPPGQVHGRVVLEVLDVAPALQNER